VCAAGAVVARYLQQLCVGVETTRQGFVLALGAFPPFMLHGNLRQIMAGLVLCLRSSQAKNMAEARRDTIKALAQ
jgi:hypothetical protein